MAHCGSCKSNLGTGGMKKGTGGLYEVQGALVRARRATGEGDRSGRPLILANGKINKQYWIPASSQTLDSSELTQWAYFPGGRKANLRINGRTQTRYVLAHKNGGPTGLLVRLGEIARSIGTGGCGDLTGLPGTGGVPSVNMRSGASWKGTGKQVANRWFPATYGPQPNGSPESWIVLVGPIPGPAELWMSGAGPLHKHDVEVIQVKPAKGNGQYTALVAGWSLPHMINDLTYSQTGKAGKISVSESYAAKGGGGTGARHSDSSYRTYQQGYWPAGTGGAKASAEARALLAGSPLQGDECIVVYYGGQAYICCGAGGDCVPLPILGPSDTELFKHRFPHGTRVPYSALGFKIPQFDVIFSAIAPIVPKYLTM